MKKLGIFVLLLITAFESQAFHVSGDQVSDSIPAKPGFGQAIWVNIGQIGRNEIQVSFEKYVSRSVALEFSLGYKYAEKNKEPFEVSLSSMLKLDTYDYAERMPFSQGMLVGLGLKAYVNDKDDSWVRTYLAPSIFYRNRSYEHQFITSYTLQPDQRNTGSTLQSLDLHIYGFKLLAGNTLELFKFKDRKKILADLYYGFGFRVKKAKTSYFGYDQRMFGSENVIPIGPPSVEKAENKWASLHAGFRLGFQF